MNNKKINQHIPPWCCKCSTLTNWK